MKATKARGFGRQYWQLLWGYKGPPVDAGWTNEVEPPYRYGHCVVRRVGRLPLALVRGRWLSQHDGPASLDYLMPKLDAFLALDPPHASETILAILDEPLHEIR